MLKSNDKEWQKRLKKYQFLNGVDSIPIWMFEKLPEENEKINEANFNEFFETMFERQEIWYNRFSGKKRPWSKNEILADFKFTNVFRELDRSSQFLIKNILLKKHNSVEDMLFKMLVYRFVNTPNSFDEKETYHATLPCFNEPIIESSTKFHKQICDIRDKGKRNPWHIAYVMNVVSLQKQRGVPKHKPENGILKDLMYAKYVVEDIHSKVEELKYILETEENVENVIEFLRTILGVGSFMSHELFIDFCYINKYCSNFEVKFDENSYTNVGPGASLGLRMIFPSMKPKEQLKGITLLRDCAKEFLNPKFKQINWNNSTEKYEVSEDNANITLHQIEMWLCEYSKYFKMKHGVGKKRAKFKPSS